MDRAMTLGDKIEQAFTSIQKSRRRLPELALVKRSSCIQAKHQSQRNSRRQCHSGQLRSTVSNIFPKSKGGRSGALQIVEKGTTETINCYG
mmetsp:Transcript_4413/g.6970  ORF Transcript_4413/g.6970 Transcript_4413/m.6970 type:complete len:91 (+) Transcript_4413:921-1193(+)